MKFDRANLLLYAVTDRMWLGEMMLSEQVEAALAGGVTMVQLREKSLGFDSFLDEAKSLKKLCERYGVPFIINDNIEIATQSNADGIHIGQGDVHPGEARKILGREKIIGVTVHTPEQAVSAERNGADYLGCGAVFGTSTKDDVGKMNIDILKQICTCVSIPVVAIGGISKDNLSQLKGSGISGIAVVSGIFSSHDITAATRELRKKAEECFK